LRIFSSDFVISLCALSGAHRNQSAWRPSFPFRVAPVLPVEPDHLMISNAPRLSAFVAGLCDRQCNERSLADNDGAATLLGMEPTTLWSRLRSLGISSEK
jgi:hypothetical protein